MARDLECYGGGPFDGLTLRIRDDAREIEVPAAVLYSLPASQANGLVGIYRVVTMRRPGPAGVSRPYIDALYWLGERRR